MKIALLGCGSIGRRHLANLLILGERELMGYDPSEEACRTASRLSGARCSTDLNDVWDWGPDVVFVTAPTYLHGELSIEAAKRGCHLFIEKPLAMSKDAAVLIDEEVRSRRLVTMVGCNMRFHPGPATIKKLLAENKIGAVLFARFHSGSYLPEWRPGSDYRRSYSASSEQGGGIILDCIHEMDLALWLFGHGRVVGAAALPATSIGLQVEGIAEILIKHQTGQLSSVHVNFVQRDYCRTCLIVGSEGSLSWDFREGAVRLHQPGSGVSVFRQPPDWSVNQMYVDELSEFLSCVSERRDTENNVQTGLEVLEVALRAKSIAGSPNLTNEPATYSAKTAAH